MSSNEKMEDKIMENKTKLRFFENAWRTDLLTKTEIFRSMLEPYTEEELKELTEDKLVETYNHYVDTYLDLIMKRCIGIGEWHQNMHQFQGNKPVLTPTLVQ